MRTRAEHLQWCKDRALEYVKIGDVQNAFSSILGDLGKHKETSGHFGIAIGMQLMMAGQLSSVQQMREFIEGFN